MAITFDFVQDCQLFFPAVVFCNDAEGGAFAYMYSKAQAKCTLKHLVTAEDRLAATCLRDFDFTQHGDGFLLACKQNRLVAIQFNSVCDVCDEDPGKLVALVGGGNRIAGIFLAILRHYVLDHVK